MTHTTCPLLRNIGNQGTPPHVDHTVSPWSLILQLKLPDEMRDRVASVNSMFGGSSNELGAFESGLTARFFGTVNAVVLGGRLTILTVVGTGIKFPKLRKLDFSEDEEK